MRTRKLIIRATLALAVCVTLAGCVAHEKNGDRAAALGDWKTALREYREGLSRDPDSQTLKQKYDRARGEASKEAFHKAQACAARENWACAVEEAGYALQIDEGNSEISMFHANASKSLALSLLNEARAASASGRFAVAFEKLKKAEAASSAPDVATEMQQVRTEVVAAADAEVDRLRQGQSLRDALELMQLVASADGTKTAKLETIRREYEQFLDAEYERHARDGDSALAQKDWALAEHHYTAALGVRAGGRAAGLAQYAGAVARGEAALNKRSFADATKEFRTAADSGLDGTGYARQRLDAVEIRPYAIRIKSLLVKPIRPDGRPWVGPPNPLLGRLVKVAANYVAPGVGGVVASVVVDAAESVPPENRPSLHVQVTLPDSRKLRTPAKKSLYVVYDSEVVLDTNQFDDRTLSFKVVGAGDNVDDVGVIDVSLKDLVAKRELGLADQSILALNLVAAPVNGGQVDGMFSAMSPVSDPANSAPQFSVPTPAAHGYRLVRVEAGAGSADVRNELLEGAPDLYIVIQQGDRVVFVSSTEQDSWRASWTPESTFLFVEPGKSITVSVWDRDLENDDQIFNAKVSELYLAAGHAETSTKAGSYFRLKFERRLESLEQLRASSN